MLPRRQNSGTRALVAHSQRVSVKRVLLGALAAVFLLCVYFNYRFVATSAVADKRRSVAVAKGGGGALSAQLSFETRKVKQLVFTSGCADIDHIHGEVLAYTARSTGFDGNVTHLMYGCTDAAFRALVAKKNPLYGVQSVAFPAIKEAAYLFGEGQLTTTVHPQVVQEWLAQADLARVDDDDFLMIVDNDAVFTKKVDIWTLSREVEDVKDPKWFGQDAAWYWPGRFPLKGDVLETIVPSNSRTKRIQDWREYAVTAPFVVELGVLKKVLPDVAAFWPKLATEKRHLAFPLAAAHHRIPFGVSGILSVHHYPSRYENWDFVDDVKFNPCNESATGKNIELTSYPITMRAQNFTLPTWIDGRDWNFFDIQVPSDILSCDAWLFNEPTGYLWYLASHTNGYERVPTILRRRHTMSVCLVLQAYNRAIVDYKKQSCPFGYNTNKKVPMVLHGETWATAVALAPQTVVEHEPVVQFGDYKKKAATPQPKPGQADSDDIHFVFSTTCESYQDWQSQVLAHSFERVKQRGSLTRIISGCKTDEDLKTVLARSMATSPFMRVHVTKKFSDRPVPETMKLQDDYAPYNKPFGIRDWLRTANPPVTESIIVIIDPDFMFLKPFVVNSGFRVTKGKDVDSENYKEHSEVIEGLRQYKPFFVYEGTRNIASVTDRVVNGVAIAQRWSSYLGPVGFDDPNGTNLKVCPDCRTTKEEALEYYSVGPPYALTRHDLNLFVDDYCNMTTGKRELHRDLWMAEMFGYVLASSRHNIKHTTFDNLALAGKEDEYWSFIDLIKGNPCEDPVEPMIPAEVPTMLHGCHTYKGKDDKGHEWLYYKQFMPSDLFACDSWMLAVPPASVWTVAKASRDKKQMKHAYGLCTTVKVVNQALYDHKKRVCVDGFNENRKLRLVDPRPADLLRVGRVSEKWENAAQEVVSKKKSVN
uniref:Hydroxyproline O-arabinosyltransferase-like domain-containing protein n=1 Tax=Globisporangium ultimum (strain ATCC 200006 / CBS 805.95 / DAOM BR144) TaxID=431595 RepID=K3WNV0_GLOUD